MKSKEIGDEIGYRLLRWSVWLVSLLPMRVHYLFSGFLAWLARDVVKYRRKVVHKNISESFPEKPADEILAIEKRFYGWFADYIVETVKCASMSQKEMFRRMRFENLEEVNAVLREGRTVILYLGHYGNWEWVASLPMHLEKSAVRGQIYHKLSSHAFDRLLLGLRSRWEGVNVEMHDTLRAYRQWQQEGKASVIGFIADQVPNYDSIHLWVPFLNHDTPVFSGAERIARMTHAATFYCEVSRPKRGEYLLRMHKMADDASKTEKFSQTKEYFRRLEEDIRRQPEIWLWSHRRWKRTRARWEELMKRQQQ